MLRVHPSATLRSKFKILVRRSLKEKRNVSLKFVEVTLKSGVVGKFKHGGNGGEEKGLRNDEMKGSIHGRVIWRPR